MKAIVQILRKMMGRPSCEEVNRFLAEFVEGTLPADIQAKFAKHVDGCKCCGSYLDDYKTTIKLAKSCQDVAIPDKLADSTVEFLQSYMKDA